MNALSAVEINKDFPPQKIIFYSFQVINQLGVIYIENQQINFQLLWLVEIAVREWHQDLIGE